MLDVRSRPRDSGSGALPDNYSTIYCCLLHILVVVDIKSFPAVGGLHEDTLRDILQAMAPTYVETIHQTSLFHIESNLDWQLLFCSLSSMITRQIISPNTQ